MLFKHNIDKPLPSKLLNKYAGHYKVLKHVKNDVKCRYLALKILKFFYVGDLKPFTGSLESAKELAIIDADQFEVERIIAHGGHPYKRTNMEFFVQF